MRKPISKEDLPQLEHNRRIVISDGDDFNGEPFIVVVDYLGTSNAAKGVEMDNAIMPVIRTALADYVKKRARADMTTRRLYVNVAGLTCRRQDQDDTGTYIVDVDASLRDHHAASCPLDVFHENVPIKVLDDVEITVYNSPDLRNVHLLTEDEKHTNGSLIRRGRWIGKA